MCQSCCAVKINGVLSHEHGCPDSWKSYRKECKWCGNMFIPEYRTQEFCQDSCYFNFNGIPDPEDTELCDEDIEDDDNENENEKEEIEDYGYGTQRNFD